MLNLNDTQVNEDTKFDILKYFISFGVSHNSSNSYNQTPLHIASKKQYTKIIDFLVNKVNTNTIVKNSFKMTPLHLAIQGNIVECKKQKKQESIIDLPEYKEKNLRFLNFLN